MKKAILENYTDDIKTLVTTCYKLSNHLTGVKYLPEFLGRAIEWHRINHCQAWFYETQFNGDRVVFIRSYNTVVGFLYQGTLYSLGRYSMTTYQHIRKFRNNYTRDSYNTPEKNLALVDWF